MYKRKYQKNHFVIKIYLSSLQIKFFMKKITLLLSFVALVGISNAASFPKNSENINSEYVLNDQQVDALFASSTDITAEITMQSNDAMNLLASGNNQNATTQVGSKNALTAILLDFFLGGLGIHRMYLGTKTMTWIGYILTCGGIGGLVPLVDFIVLIVNYNDISKFEGNPKFFMWTN